MKFIVKKGADHQWRWSLVATNGKTIADSGEGYHNKEDCLSEVEQIRRGAGAATVEEKE